MEPRPVPGRRPGATTTTPPSGRPRARRHVLRALFGLGMVAGTSAALTPVFRADRREPAGADKGADAPGGAEAVDEVYRGRHIRIGATGSAYTLPGARFLALSALSPLPPASTLDIRIDGRPLQLMRRADGSYLSAVNHYESFPTPLAAARAAVEDLAGAELSISGPIHHI
ncbi:tyrosinase family oxidase copper chaperone [Streptomyces lushanensis]|uniref:tyrosinase family oxidase copper chaperone n=1 Tax=Streptomyces lushanensis TaxID=1434255 RepID=UPI00082E99FE|nr:tyrosinase family oxidase copper chaperone [Streptomyces lushanensis]